MNRFQASGHNLPPSLHVERRSDVKCESLCYIVNLSMETYLIQYVCDIWVKAHNAPQMAATLLCNSL